MAKSTKSGGASFTEDELSDPQLPETIVRVTRAEIGGVPSPGTRSTPSFENEPTSDEVLRVDLPSPVLTTENLSQQIPENPDTSSAPSMGGNGPEMVTESDDLEADYEEWSYAELQAECKARGLSATGKAPELIARLRENDGVEAVEEIDEDDF